jgi:hypothetical protein
MPIKVEVRGSRARSIQVRVRRPFWQRYIA